MHNVTAFHIFAQFRLLSWYARLRLPEHKKKVTENPRNEWEFAMMLYEITFFVFLYEEHLYNRPLHSSCSSPVPCAGQTNGCPLVGLS